jgi:hypothetical protein
MSLITGRPGGAQVVRTLHKKMGLAHDIEYAPVQKISWSELKDNYRGTWVIIVGSTGVGAIQSNRGSYTALASTGEEAESFKSDRGGNILDFLKGKIGKLQKFYVGKNTSTVTTKKEKRSELKQRPDATMDRETIMKKFKPLWSKAMTTAIADVKGHIANMIQNDAFSKAEKKLEHVKRLQVGLEALEAGETHLELISNSVQMAIYMAASYYYPEQTGEITRGYGRSYNPENQEGPNRVLNDIAQGDTQKLGTVLAYFKRNLISG